MNTRGPSRWLLALFFIVAGANHFRDPGFYLPTIPSWFPWHQELVALSGGAEIVGGIAAMVPFTRRTAGWGLIALLIAVFPANVNTAIDHPRAPERPLVDLLLWLRLPVQAVLIAWVWWTLLEPRERPPD
jgi:uncharacterized membrane protein